MIIDPKKTIYAWPSLILKIFYLPEKEQKRDPGS